MLNEPRYTVRRESRRRSSRSAAERARRVATEQPFKDVMHGDARWEIPVHDHGFVALVDAMPRLVPEGQTADSAIVQAARVSYGAGTKKVNEDRGLIRYLLRHRHTTPFEMIEFKFHIAMPIFVARQWIRHRTANVNEYSARYSIVPDWFYRPSIENVRKQSTTNRQGGEESIEVGTAEEFLKLLEDSRPCTSGISRSPRRASPARSPARAPGERVHRVVLEVRPPQHPALPLPSNGRARPDRDPGLRHGDVRPHQGDRPAHLRGVRGLPHQRDAAHGLEIDALRTGQPLASTNSRENAEWEARRKRLWLD